MTPIEDSVDVPAARQWPGNSADDDLDKELRGAEECESCAIVSLRSGDLIISPFRGTYRSDDLARSIEPPLKPDHRVRSGPGLAK
jgi:hypothetical protein